MINALIQGSTRAAATLAGWGGWPSWGTRWCQGASTPQSGCGTLAPASRYHIAFFPILFLIVLHKSRSARSPWTAPWCRWSSPALASSSTATRRAKWTSSTSRPLCAPDSCRQSSSAWTSTGIKDKRNIMDGGHDLSLLSIFQKITQVPWRLRWCAGVQAAREAPGDGERRQVCEALEARDLGRGREADRGHGDRHDQGALRLHQRRGHPGQLPLL